MTLSFLIKCFNKYIHFNYRFSLQTYNNKGTVLKKMMIIYFFHVKYIEEAVAGRNRTDRHLSL